MCVRELGRMIFERLCGLPSAMARRRALAIALLRCPPPPPFLPPPPLFVPKASFATDFLSLDDLPPPRMPLPRPRSSLSAKRRLAQREPMDELADFHGLENSTFQETLDRLDRLDKIGIRAHPATYAALLQSAGNRDTLKDGKLVHDHIVVNKFDNDIALSGLIIQMYRRCKSVEGAREWFDKIEKRNLYMWNCMLGTYAQYSRSQEALDLFEKMQQEKVVSDKDTYLAVLAVIAGEALLPQGRRLHAYINRSPYKGDITVGTAIVRMYGRCANLKDARKMFHILLDRNVGAWNALIQSYARNQHYQEALQFVNLMLNQDEFPDKVTIATAFSVCANLTALAEAKQILARIMPQQGGLEADKIVLVSLVDVFGKCGELEEAHKIFSKLAKPDVIAWNTLMKAHVQHGRGKEALELFEKMKQAEIKPNRVSFICGLCACASQAGLAEGKDMQSQISDGGFESDVAVVATLINMYGKCGSLQDAREVFDKFTERNVILWNAMIAAYAENGHGEEALKLFDQLQKEGLTPDKNTYMSILTSCARQSPELASEMFGKMPDKNVAAWNTMIGVYVKHGHSKQATQLFDQMQREGLTADKDTFINVLSACASPSAPSEGKGIHICISRSNLETDILIANALVNMYGKCGCLDDAKKAFNKISTPTAMLWASLIAAHAQNGQKEEAQNLFKKEQAEGVFAADATYDSVLSSSSGPGLADQDQHRSGAENYSRIVDLLGKAEGLEEFENLIYNVPFIPPNVTYSQLLAENNPSYSYY